MNARVPTVDILLRADQGITQVRDYAIDGMAALWQGWGIEVRYVFGPAHWRARPQAPADLLFVHVDLTVVPQAYLQLAGAYRRVLNGGIRDIRKSVVCDRLVREGDAYDGPVLVKSELNAAGIPERKARTRLARKLARILQRLAPPRLAIEDQQDYRVFPSIRSMPPAMLRDRRLVVQRFVPEMEHGLYHVRNYSFLGDRATCMRLSSREPVIHLGNTLGAEPVEPHPDIVAVRHRLAMDYGKLDYVMHDGEAILLDVNKTLGAQREESNPLVLSMRRERALGIFSCLGLPVPPAAAGLPGRCDAAQCSEPGHAR